MGNYTIYHCHTMCSLLDSATSFEEYVDKAAECGMNTIGFTEHGNVYNWFNKMEYCQSKGLKFLYGIECYLTESDDQENRLRDNYHTVLIAKNHDGFIELNRLISKTTQPDHFYYKPRLTFDEFLGISDNIIKISACLASPLWSFKKRLDIADEEGRDTSLRREKYIQLAKHYDYYEIQYHDGDQVEYNKLLWELSKTFGKPLIAGTDTHSIDNYKAECRVILQYGKTDGDWSNGENEYDLTFKDYDSLVAAFKKQDSLPKDVYLAAIEETNRMADSVEPLEIDTSIKYPILYEGQDEDKIMMDRVMKMYNEKVAAGIIDGSNHQYLQNINTEMEVFRKINMVGFMLFMSELMVWARSKNIYTSPCRGSVGGSTVAYVTDIIDLDPVKRHTVFSRFANEYREEVGDIDTDWYEDDRPIIYQHMFDRFGNRKCAYILAFGTLADAAAIDTIGKAYRVIAEQSGTETEYTLQKIKEIKQEWAEDREKTRKKYPDIFKYYDGLVGCIVSQSQHPAGIVVAPIDLIDNYSVFQKDGTQILPLDMDEVHECGLVKYDILGLKNVGIIAKSCEYAGVDLPHEYNINWDDQDVFEDMMKSPVGIFQFESEYAFRTIKEYYKNLKAQGGDFSIDDMTLCNACIRPSGASYRDQLIALKPNHNPSKMIDDLLSNTHGWLVYQEQVIAFLQQICGLSGGEADNVRRAIGRKQIDRLEAALPGILEGYCSKSDKPREVAEEEAKSFIKVIEDSASYMFGFNHATGYSMVGYLCAYYRYYYPLEFCTAFLNCSKTEADFNSGVELAKSKGFKILSPRFGYSRAGFFFDRDNKSIYKSIDSIKHMNKAVAEEMYALRDNRYYYFTDLLYDLKEHTSLDSRQLDILIKLNFFSAFGDINKLLYVAFRFGQLAKRKTLKRSDLKELELDTKLVRRFAEKETATRIDEVDWDRYFMVNMLDPEAFAKCHKPSGAWSTKKISKALNIDLESPDMLPYATKIVIGSFSGIDNRKLLRNLEDDCKAPPCPIDVQMAYQKEYLGYIEYTNPELDPRLVMVTNLDTRYTPRFDAYCLKTGEIKTLKVHKRIPWKNKDVTVSFKELPFKDGDILRLKKCKLEPRMYKDANDEWQKDYSDMQWWVKDYGITSMEMVMAYGLKQTTEETTPVLSSCC